MSRQEKHGGASRREAWMAWLGGTTGMTFRVPVFVCLAVVAVLALLWVTLHPATPVVERQEAALEQTVLRHPLTGAVALEPVQPAIYAVMVENALDAQPQAGVEQAFYVYEAPVEGNITRWMALFSADQEVRQIGPVRSARPYYVDWVQGWGALYAHVGGSPAALEQIEDEGVRDVNEFYWASTFWRSKQRSAPHDVYTETARLSDAWERVDGETATYAPRRFEATSTAGTDPQTVTVPFQNAAYDVTWVYDPETDTYTRFQNNRVHRMASGAPLVAQNLVVLFTKIETIDEIGRKAVETSGSGTAMLFQHGQAMEVTWRKPHAREREQFIGADGNAILWVPGTTWVEVVWEGTDVSIE